MANLAGEIRQNLPANYVPVRVKMGMTERMIRMLRKGSIGFGLVAMVTLCIVSRFLASLVAHGRIGTVLCIAIFILPMIFISGCLLADDKARNQ